MASAHGFPTVRHLQSSMSQSEYLELVEWMNIRGPVGPARWDYYFANIVMLLRNLSGSDKKIKWEDCLPGWLKPQEASGIHFITPWIDDE